MPDPLLAFDDYAEPEPEQYVGVTVVIDDFAFDLLVGYWSDPHAACGIEIVVYPADTETRLDVLPMLLTDKQEAAVIAAVKEVW